MFAQFTTSFNIWRIIFSLAVCTSGAAFSQGYLTECGSLQNDQYGPIDYRPDKHKPSSIYDQVPHKAHMDVVQKYHFTPEVEALVRGTTGSIGGDIDYTLRAIPNHHRALLAMMRLGEKEKTPQPTGSRYSVECWLKRALLFRSDDAIVRMIYATFLGKNARTPEAVQQLEKATALAGENAFTHHNIGLIYFDLKLYDKALNQAHKAVSLGLLRPALRDQLEGIGKWVEAPSELNRPTSDTRPSLESQ